MMKTRIITGSFIFLFFALVAFATLKLTNIVFDVFVLFLMVAGAYEMMKAFSAFGTKPYSIFVYGLIVIGYAAFAVAENNGIDGITVFFLVLVAIFIVLLLLKLVLKKIEMKRVLSTMFVMIYPVAVMTYMLGINYFGGGDNVYRTVGIILIFLVSPLTDSMAYFVGSALKGPKLCPKISPKKTVSGAVGGLLGGMFAAIIVYLLAMSGVLSSIGLGLFGKGNDVLHFLALGFLGAVATQAGDLIASIIKRKCGIKDYGKLLPGHGGVMDRVDGMIFCALVYYVYFLFLCV